MMATVLAALTPRHADDLWEVPDELPATTCGFVPDHDLPDLPIFLGRTYADYVTTWRDVDATAQKIHWMRAAIAASLVRATGGRPGSRNANTETAIQKFIKDVGTNRQTFHRYCHTHQVFAETRTTGVTSYFQLLSFKHFVVAASYYDDEPEDAVRAIVEAHDKKWSANELERQLKARTWSGPKPFSLAAAYRFLLNFIGKWPLADREEAPAMLRRLAEQVERALPPQVETDLPSCLYQQATAEKLHDMEVM
jgi:hypothetical protein